MNGSSIFLFSKLDKPHNPGMANLFQIACQYFRFEKQRHSRVPCPLFFFTTFAIIYYKNIFHVLGDLG